MILVLRVLIVLMLACLPVRAEEEMEFDIDTPDSYATRKSRLSGLSHCLRATSERRCMP